MLTFFGCTSIMTVHYVIRDRCCCKFQHRIQPMTCFQFPTFPIGQPVGPIFAGLIPRPCSKGGAVHLGQNVAHILFDSNTSRRENPFSKYALTSLRFVYLFVVRIDKRRHAAAAVAHQNSYIHRNAVVTRQRQFDVLCGPGDVELNNARHRTAVILQLNVADNHRLTSVRGTVWNLKHKPFNCQFVGTMRHTKGFDFSSTASFQQLPWREIHDKHAVCKMKWRTLAVEDVRTHETIICIPCHYTDDVIKVYSTALSRQLAFWRLTRRRKRRCLNQWPNQMKLYYFLTAAQYRSF